MTSFVRGSLVASTLVVMMSWMAVSGQVMSDETADRNIDTLSLRGIQLLLRWRKTFMDTISSINDTLNEAEYLLNNDFVTDNLPNLTAYADEQLVNVRYTLADVETMVSNLNLSDTGDGLVAFMKTPSHTLNVGAAYDPSNQAGGIFTAPRDGLYQVIVRTTVGSSVSIDIVKNNNETISSLSHGHYYDIKLRVALVTLKQGDTITTTGTLPSYFGAMLLRVQTLMPSFV